MHFQLLTGLCPMDLVPGCVSGDSMEPLISMPNISDIVIEEEALARPTEPPPHTCWTHHVRMWRDSVEKDDGDGCPRTRLGQFTGGFIRELVGGNAGGG